MTIVLAQLLDTDSGSMSVPNAVGSILHLSGRNALARVDSVQSGQVALVEAHDSRLSATRLSQLRNGLGLTSEECPDLPFNELLHYLLTTCARADRWGRLRAEHDKNERIYLGRDLIYGPKPGPASALMFADTFTGNNGDAWNASYWTTSTSTGVGSTTGAITVDNNKGRLTLGSQQSSARAQYAYTNYDYTEPAVNVDVVVDTAFQNQVINTGWYIAHRAYTTAYENNEYFPRGGVFLYRQCAGSLVDDASNVIRLFKKQFFNNPVDLDVTQGVYDYTTTFRYRFQVSGSNFYYRRWQSTTSEHSTWDVQATDTFSMAGPKLVLGCSRNTSTTGNNYAEFDNLELWDLDRNSSLRADYTEFPKQLISERARGQS